MTFEYWCNDCKIITEVWASIGEAPEFAHCTSCGNKANRQYTVPQVFGTKTEDAEYNPAFGQVVKSKRHREELAKRHNMIEVGTEKVDTLLKHQDNHINKIKNSTYED